jgi:NhaP-type Na+/H+ or K+/H+ antiporter
MESNALFVLLIGTLLIAAVSKRIRRTMITLPILYTLFGLLIAVLFSDFVKLSYHNPVVEIIAELTLVLVLATDASRMKLRNLWRYFNLPLRMLLVALPLTFILGTLVGAILFRQLNIWLLAILAVTLAPIDPSLAESSVENKGVPVRIRQALNVEAGVDDGITLPFLLLFISLAVSRETGVQEGIFLKSTAIHVAFGVLAGVITGYLGSRYISWGKESGWMSSPFQKIGWLALVLLTYGFAEAIDGNGLIAAFLFGVISGNSFDRQESERLYSYAEVENTSLMMLTFMFYGSVMLYPALQQINSTILLYALLSLTLVRMLPVAISLIGTNLRLESILYLGWFGPVGIASILYVYTILDAEKITGQDTIFNVVMITIFFSVLAHGISAVPLTNWYAKRIARLEKDGLAQAERTHVPEMPTRRASLSTVTAPVETADASKAS